MPVIRLVAADDEAPVPAEGRKHRFAQAAFLAPQHADLGLPARACHDRREAVDQDHGRPLPEPLRHCLVEGNARDLFTQGAIAIAGVEIARNRDAADIRAQAVPVIREAVQIEKQPRIGCQYCRHTEFFGEELRQLGGADVPGEMCLEKCRGKAQILPGRRTAWPACSQVNTIGERALREGIVRTAALARASLSGSDRTIAFPVKYGWPRTIPYQNSPKRKIFSYSVQ
jgi:hypothetical protein